MFKGNCFNLSYSKKFPFVKISKDNLFSIFFLAVSLGVLAWFYETLVDYIGMGWLFDRGFLIGPFIPVYFFVTFIGLCFIKTPKASVKNFFLSILIVGAGISAVEFIVGYACEFLIGEVLWTYDGFMPLSYKYVSLTVALIWGVLGTIIAMFIVPIAKKIPEKINVKYRKPFTIIFLILFISDIIASIALVIKNDGYKQLYQFRASMELSLFMIGILLYILVAIFLGIFICKSFTRCKLPLTIIYIVSVIIPVFSCIDYFERFTNPFFIFLSSLGFIILAFYIYFLLTVITLHLIRFSIKIFSKHEFYNSKLCKNAIIYLGIVCSIIITSCGIGAIKNPKVSNIEVGNGNKSLNIVAVSDIHYYSTGTNVDLEKMVYHINSLKPDVVFLLGDIIDNFIDNIDQDYFINNMNNITSTYGTYAVSGNHEYEYDHYNKVFSFFRKTNIDLLVDEYAFINDEVLVVGRLDYIFSSRQPLNEIIPENNKLPVIVLDHQPQDFDEAVDNNVVLQLSGHTHNGQLFPANIFVKLFSSIVYKSSYINGLYKKENSTLYVSSGYGTWGFPLKTVGRSEIIQIKFNYD